MKQVKRKREGVERGVYREQQERSVRFIRPFFLTKKKLKKVKDLCNNKPGLNFKMIKLTGMGFCFKNRRVDYDSKTTVTLFFFKATQENTKGISDLIMYFKVQL